MPIIKSAIKRMRQTATRRTRNQATKRDFRGAIKAFLTAPSNTSLQTAQSEIDTAVKKNVLDKNTASRRKARLVKVAKTAGVKPAKTATKAVAKPATTKKPAAKSATTKAPAAKKPIAKKPVAKKPAVKPKQ